MWKPGACDLWREHCRFVAALGNLRRQDSERQKARRSAGGAADEVRVRNQSQGRQADRPDDSAECVGEGGPGYKIISDCEFRISD